MKEIDAAIEALEAALSDDQPYLDRCKAALAGLRSLTAKQGEAVAWEPFIDTIYSDETSYKVELPWLEGYDKDHCASLTVVFNKYDGVWAAMFWHGNRGYDIGQFAHIEEAKDACVNRMNEVRFTHPAPEAKQEPWAGLDLDGMYKAFDRLTQTQGQKSPFHNPVYEDAMLALRELRHLIPKLKRYTHPATEAKQESVASPSEMQDVIQSQLYEIAALEEKVAELRNLNHPAPVNQQLLEALKRISAIPLGDDIEMHMIARAAIAAVKGKV